MDLRLLDFSNLCSFVSSSGFDKTLFVAHIGSSFGTCGAIYVVLVLMFRKGGHRTLILKSDENVGIMLQSEA